LAKFIFITIENNILGDDHMAKSHYSFKKRKKELARKFKQEQKRQRKRNKGKGMPEDNPDKSSPSSKTPDRKPLGIL
jgi:hypothetical protein